MAIEVRSLGKKPVIEHVPGSGGGYDFKVRMAEQEEVIATGKDVQALRGNLKRAKEHQLQTEEVAKDKFGTDKIADRFGVVHERRRDEIARLENMQMGWGSQPAKMTMIVPALPWQSDRRPGETYSAYMARRGRARKGAS